MPYAVKCESCRSAHFYLCKEENDVLMAANHIASIFNFNFIAMLGLVSNVDLWLESKEEMMHFAPATFLKISEEVYDQWQQAFLQL